MRLTNYPVAERFLGAALELLDGADGLVDAPLRLALQIERHAALVSLGRLEEADDLYQVDRAQLPRPAGTREVNQRADDVA